MSNEPPDSLDEGRNPYRGIADKCRLSERTVRSAFAKKPVTWETARRIARACGIDLREFRIKADNRGKNKKSKATQASC